MSMFKDYMSAQIIAGNPALMGQYLDDRNTRRTAREAVGLMGDPAMPEEEPFQAEYMEGEELPPQGLMSYTGETLEPTGLFAGANEEETQMLEFNKKALMSDAPDLQKMAINNLQNYQQATVDPASMRGFGAGRYIFEDEEKNQWWVGNVTDKGTGSMETVYSPVNPALQGQQPKGQLNMVDRTYGMTGEDKIRFEAEKKAAVEEAQKRTTKEVEFYTSYVPELMQIEDGVHDMEVTQSLMNELSGMADYSSTGFGAWLRGIPLTDSNRWNELKSTVMSRLALDKMMQLKAASSTGATGFGALSEKELKLLTDHLGSLEQTQDPKVIKHILKQIYDQLEHTKGRFRVKMDHNREKYISLHKKYGRGRPMPSYVQQDNMKYAPKVPANQPATAPTGGASWNDLPDK